MAALGSALLCHGEIAGVFRWTGNTFALGQERTTGYQGLEFVEQIDVQCVSKERI